MVEWVAINWGNIASVIGLFISSATYFMAKRARQAANEARTEARRRSLAEEIQDLSRKAEEIGMHLLNPRWELVWLRSQEIANSCSHMLTRWTADLSGSSKDNILKIQGLAASIAKGAMAALSSTPSVDAVKLISTTQGRIARLINTELGEARSRDERTTKHG